MGKDLEIQNLMMKKGILAIDISAALLMRCGDVMLNGAWDKLQDQVNK